VQRRSGAQGIGRINGIYFVAPEQRGLTVASSSPRAMDSVSIVRKFLSILALGLRSPKNSQ
jgi:hypothetical protein